MFFLKIRFIDKEQRFHASLRKNFGNFTQAGKGDAMRNLRIRLFNARTIAFIALILMNHLYAKQVVRSKSFTRPTGLTSQQTKNQKQFFVQTKKVNTIREKAQPITKSLRRNAKAVEAGFFKEKFCRGSLKTPNIILIDEDFYSNPESSLGDISTGFTIPADTIVVWAIKNANNYEINGPIIWSDDSSILRLDNNIALGEAASLVGGYSKEKQENVVLIDGQGNNIKLQGDLTISGATQASSIYLLSNLVIDGQNNILTLAEFNHIGRWGQHDAQDVLDFTLCNMELSFSSSAAGTTGIFADNHYNLANVTIDCPQGGNLLGHDASLSLFANIVFGAKNQRISLVGDGAQHNVRIEQGARCYVSPDVTFQFGDSLLGYSNIIMADQTSTLIFDSCSIYTGAKGTIIVDGTIKYKGYIELFNGDLKSPFVANTDPGNAYISYSTEEYLPGSSLNVYGLKLEATVAITDKNASLYKKGFTIPKNAIYVWDSSTVVTGPIQFTDSSSVLILNENLALSSTGSLFTANGDIPNNGTLKSPEGWQVIQIIDNSNAVSYKNGFFVPANAVYVWNSSTVVNKTITSNQENGQLSLNQDLLIAPNTAINIASDANISLNGNVILQAITDNIATQYTSGFIIQPYVTMVWAVQSPELYPINGPITWADQSSILSLNNGLYLGPKGQFVGSSYNGEWGTLAHLAAIDGQDCTIHLSNNISLPGIAALSDIAFDGRGQYTIEMDNTYNTEASATFWGQFASIPPTITLRNLNLNLSVNGQDASYYFPFFALNQVELDNTKLNADFFNGCGSRYSLSNGIINGFIIFNHSAITQKNSPCGIELGTSYYDYATPLALDSDATLLVNAPKFSQVQNIVMDNNSASIRLKNTDFYSGNSGLVIEGGNLEYEGQVALFNGSYKYALDGVYSDGEFVPNTDPENAFVFNRVAQNTLPKASLSIHGFVKTNNTTTLGINESNAASFVDGFTIPTNSTYIWDSCAIITGFIEFTDSSSILELRQPLTLGDTGGLFAVDGSIPNNGTIHQNNFPIIQIIGESGSADYAEGFTIPAGTTMVWNVPNPEEHSINGPIIWGNQSSLLQLKSNIHLGKDAVLAGGIYEDWNINAIFIDGKKQSIVLHEDTQIVGASNAPTGLFTGSDLSIEGRGNKLSCPNLYLIGGWTEPNTLELKNITFEFSNLLAEPVLWNNNYIFENVKILCPDNGCIFGYGSTAMMAGAISFGAPGEHIVLIEEPYANMPVIIAPYATVTVNPGVTFEIINSTDTNKIDLKMDDSSTLFLNSCNFYTGTNGLTISQGLLKYQSTVGLFNGNYTNPFAANTDPKKAFFVLSSAEEQYLPATNVQVFGIKENLQVTTIVDANASSFEHGFEIPAHSLFIWDSSYVVDGPITFADDTSYLQLAQDLIIGDQGSLFGLDGSILNDGNILNEQGHSIIQIVSTNNSSEYVNGFIIPAQCTIAWAEADPTKTIDGSVSWTDETSILQLHSNLILGQSAMFYPGNMKSSPEACVVIDGQDNTIILNNNLTLQSDGGFPTNLFTHSNLTINGQGYSLICSGFDIIGPWETSNSIALQNMNLVFEEANPNEWALFFDCQVILDNVKILCPQGGNLLGVGASLIVRNNVALGSAGQRIALARYEDDIPVTIESGATLRVNKGVICEVGRTGLGKALINPNDYTAKIALDQCSFYTGADGLTIINGTLEYNGAVKLYNADLNGAVNNDPAHSFKLYDTVVEKYLPGATVQVTGLKETIQLTTINNKNARKYLDGFTIAADSTVVWDASLPISGSIKFTDSSSVLVLNQPLTISEKGKIFNIDGTIPNNGVIVFNNQVISQLVGDLNSADYVNGFTIPTGCRIIVQLSEPQDQPILGPIIWADAASELFLESDLYLAQEGTIVGAFLPYSVLTALTINAQGHTIFFGNETVIETRLLFSENDMVMNGQGNVITWPNLIAISGATSKRSALTLQDMTFECTTEFDEPIFWDGDFRLDNVTVDCTDGIAFLGSNSTLSIKNTVGIEPTTKPMWLVASGQDQAVTIEQNSELIIKRGDTFIAGDSLRGTALISLVDGSSKIRFNNCDFYTGAQGLTLSAGTLVYENNVQLFNGDYTGSIDSFVPNKDTEHAFVTYEEVIEDYINQAKVTVFGLKIGAETVTVTDGNYEHFKNGFSIPSKSIVVWDCSQPVLGKITFADASSYLSLNQNLMLDGQGSLFASDGTVPSKGVVEYNGHNITQIISNDNLRNFMQGFTIPVNTSYVWQAQQEQVMNGQIIWSDNSSQLTINSDLHISSLQPFQSKGDYCLISGGKHTVYFNKDCTFGKPFHIVGDDISFNARNKTIKIAQAPFIDVYGNAAVAFEDAILAIDGAAIKNENPYIFYGDDTVIALKNVSCVLMSPLELSFLVNQISSLAIQSKVVFAGAGMEMRFAGPQGENQLFIDQGSNLVLDTNLVFIAADSRINSAKIAFADQSSQITLSGCDFYTGALGLKLSKGNLIYNGEVQIFNGDYAQPFIANTDPAHALMLDSGMIEEFAAGSTLEVFGLKFSTITITDDNVDAYNKGFVVPAYSSIAWMSDAIVDGKITLEDNTATFILENDLKLGKNGALELNGGNFEANDHSIIKRIDDGAYTGGSIDIPAHTTIVWNSSSKINGPITFTNKSSVLQLNRALNLEQSASLFSANGSIPNDGFIIFNGNQITQQIGDLNVKKYEEGFKIPVNTTFIWNPKHPEAYFVDGNIVWANETSTLQLATDIHLKENCTLIGGPAAWNENVVTIQAQGNTIFFDGELTISGQEKNLPSMIFALGNCIFDGQGGILSCPQFDAIYSHGQPCTLRNMLFSFAADKKRFPSWWPALIDGDFTLDNVELSAPEGGSVIGWDSKLNIPSKVVLGQPEQQLMLMANPEGTTLPITIGLCGQLAIPENTTCIAGDSQLGTPTFSMAGPASSIRFDSCKFYTGAQGLLFVNGALEYAGQVKIFNGDYAQPFEANTNPNNALLLSPAVIERFQSGATVEVFGLKSSPITITNANANKFTKGFTIPTNTVYVWNCDMPMQGAIQFTDATSTLMLNQDLMLTDAATLFAVDGTIPNNGTIFNLGNYRIHQTIGGRNMYLYQNGFVIPQYVKMVWRAMTPQAQVLNGTITWTDSTSSLKLGSDLYLGTNARFNPSTFVTTIDGQGKSIFFNSDLTLEGIEQYGGWLICESDTVFNAQGHALNLLSFNSIRSYDIQHPVLMTFKNMNLTFQEIDPMFWALFFYGNYIFDNVALNCPRGGNILGYGSTLTVRNTVSCGQAGQRIALACYQTNIPVTIESGSTLHINPDVSFQAGDSNLGSANIMMQDPSSVLLLDDSIFYTGALPGGMSLSTGTLQHHGETVLFNGDLFVNNPSTDVLIEEPTPNTDPSKALTLNDSLSQQYLDGATVDIVGIVNEHVELEINNFNASSFQQGFTVASNMHYVWNVDDQSIQVNGPITFEDGSATLTLKQDLHIGQFGALFNPTTGLIKVGNNAVPAEHNLITNEHTVIQYIKAENYRSYKNGFIIPASSNFVWSVPRTPQQPNLVQGKIIFSNDSSQLTLEQDIYFKHGSFASNQNNGTCAIKSIGGTINFTDDFSLQAPIEINMPLVIHGNNKTLIGSCMPLFNIATDHLEINNLKIGIKELLRDEGHDKQIPVLFNGTCNKTNLHLNDVVLSSSSAFDHNFIFHNCHVDLRGNLRIQASDAVLMWSGDSSLNIASGAALNLGTHDFKHQTSSGVHFDMSLHTSPTKTEKLALSMQESSSIILSGHDTHLYSGSLGLSIPTGSIVYDGNITLENGSLDGTINNDFGRAIVFQPSVKQLKKPDASVAIKGLAITIIDDSNFARVAASGFMVPQDHIYQWNCSPSCIVNGTIRAESNAALLLNADLFLGKTGKPLLSKNAIMSFGDYSFKMIINDSNASSYVEGFKIPANTTYVWDAEGVALAGAVNFDHNATLVLATDLYLSPKANINLASPAFVADGHSVYNLQKEALLIGINDDNYGVYDRDFYIPDGTIFEWGCSSICPINGTVTFGGESAALKLAQDLYTGPQAHFATQSRNCSIFGQGHTIFMNSNMVIDEILEFHSGITINGGGKTITAVSCPVFHAHTGEDIIIQDVRLKLDGVNYRKDHVPYICWGAHTTDPRKDSNLIFDNVIIEPTTSFTHNYVASGWKNVFFRNQVSVGGVGQTIQLGYNQAMRIEKNATLLVSPASTVIIDGSEQPKGLSTEDLTSILYLDGCSFHFDTFPSGFSPYLPYGSLVINHAVTLDPWVSFDENLTQVYVLYGALINQ